MAFSTVSYPGDGTTKDFSVTFDYLDQSHVKVRVNKVFTDEVGSDYKFTWINPTTIRVDTVIAGDPPVSGAVVELIRQTPIGTPAVVFGGGASLSSENLNKNSEYLTYALQEATDDNQAFTKLYLGSVSTFPTTDNDGDPLQVGAVIYYTPEDALYYYTSGGGWIIGESTIAAQAFRDQAEAARDIAVAAQAAAEAAEATAVASAGTASTDATAAAASAAAALASQVAAAASETAAAASEAAAVAAAATASTAATNAGTSEANAAASAASASADAASTASDAAAAAASASAAATSASNASTSETNAATSETNAAASAAAAAASAASITIASQAEAEAGTDNTKLMTPLRVANAVLALSPTPATPEVVKLASASVTSNVSFVDFTAFDHTTYQGYLFEYSNVSITDDGRDLDLMTSEDGGVTFANATGNYGYVHAPVGVTTTNATGEDQTGSQNDTSIKLVDSIGSITGSNEYGVSGRLWCWEQEVHPITGALGYWRLQGDHSYDRSDNDLVVATHAGWRFTTNRVNAIRILASIGSIECGLFTMYGIKRP